MQIAKKTNLYIGMLLVLLVLIGIGSINRNSASAHFINTNGFIINEYSSKKTGIPYFEKIIPSSEKSVHASNIVSLNNKLMVLFFGGSREGAKDVKIYQSFFDASSANLHDASWSQPRVVLTTEKLSKLTGKYIKTLGNPIVFKDSNQQVHFFVVATSLGGWATSKIYQFKFTPDLMDIIFIGELKLGPFMNISHLVRNPAVLLENGGFMLPFYNELATKFTLVAFFDANAKFLFSKKINHAKSLLQPSIVAADSNTCLAAFRVYDHQYHDSQLLQKCNDKGNSWDLSLTPSNLKNYDNSSLLLPYQQGFLFIHNDSDNNPILKNKYTYKNTAPNINIHTQHSNTETKFSSRQSLSLFYIDRKQITRDKAMFIRLATIDVTDSDGEVSYPSALLDSQYLYITYTYNRKSIKQIGLSRERIEQLITESDNDAVLLSGGLN